MKALCDVCAGKLKSGAAYYDACVPSMGWCWLCSRCARLLGVRLGTGLGQKYDSTTDEKIAG